MKTNQMPNFFIYGLSGSGKDSIANYLADSYAYVNLKLSRTVKQIICERLNITFNELEILKRENSEIRAMHNEVGNFLDKYNGSINRLKQLIDGRAFDFDYISKDTSRVISDIRAKEWINILLEAGWKGLFLSRKPNEFQNKQHKTEFYIFDDNEYLNSILEKYNKQIIIIDNNIDNILTTELITKYFDNIYETTGTLQELEETIDIIINNEL
jgi:hypothetical protein